MHFVLTGFTQQSGYRVFVFEGISMERTRTAFSVRADLRLMQRYGIPIQELPLLCRGLLEQRDEGSENRALTFTESHMQVLAKNRAAAKEAGARKRKPAPLPTGNLGAAWRGPRPS